MYHYLVELTLREDVRLNSPVAVNPVASDNPVQTIITTANKKQLKRYCTKQLSNYQCKDIKRYA